MAQKFPPGMGPRDRRTGSRQTSSEGAKVSVARSAIASAKGSDGYAAAQEAMDRDAPSVRALREQMTDKEIGRIAHLVTGKAPSARTLRRWAQQNRVPHAALADALDRHRIVAANGGVDTVAARLGRSSSAVHKWMLGRQEGFRGDANSVADEIRLHGRMIQGGMMHPDGSMKTPSIVLRAAVEVRMPGKEGYSYTTLPRVINLNSSTVSQTGHSTELAPPQARRLAMALADERTADALVIIEEHASTVMAQFDHYGENQGFHIDDITSWDITWH